jgi:hypothetical protein
MAVDVVHEDIASQERLLVTVGAQAERAAQREVDQGQLADARRWLEGRAALVDALAEHERGVLEVVRARLEEPLTAAVGAPVSIQLTDARGGPTCRIHVGGVDVASISTGERLRFVAALLVVLGRASPAPWRPVIIDGIEAVSREHREAFLARLVAAVEAGDVDQVVCAGCPDVVPEVEGVTVIRLERAAGAESEAA